MGQATHMTDQLGITDDDILDVLRDHGGAGTSEVADALDCSRQNADQRLRRLRDAGRVESRKVGTVLIWTAADDDPEGDGA